MNTVLYCLLDSIRQIGIMIQPAIPDTSIKILNIFGISYNNKFFSSLSDKLKVGSDINKQELIFPRIK